MCKIALPAPQESKELVGAPSGLCAFPTQGGKKGRPNGGGVVATAGAEPVAGPMSLFRPAPACRLVCPPPPGLLGSRGPGLTARLDRARLCRGGSSKTEMGPGLGGRSC